MNILFKYFLLKNFEDQAMEMTGEEIGVLGEEFEKYLDVTLSDEAKKKILPKDQVDIFMNYDNPLRIHGFHPAYLLHFTEFVKIMEKLAEEDNES